jgi:hypothetical protein
VDKPKLSDVVLTAARVAEREKLGKNKQVFTRFGACSAAHRYGLLIPQSLYYRPYYGYIILRSING